MIVIDLTKKKQLNESWLRMIGSWSKTLLRQMFGKDFALNMTLKEDEPNSDLKFIVRGEAEEQWQPAASSRISHPDCVKIG